MRTLPAIVISLLLLGCQSGQAVLNSDGVIDLSGTGDGEEETGSEGEDNSSSNDTDSTDDTDEPVEDPEPEYPLPAITQGSSTLVSATGGTSNSKNATPTSKYPTKGSSSVRATASTTTGGTMMNISSNWRPSSQMMETWTVPYFSKSTGAMTQRWNCGGMPTRTATSSWKPKE